MSPSLTPSTVGTDGRCSAAQRFPLDTVWGGAPAHHRRHVYRPSCERRSRTEHGVARSSTRGESPPSVAAQATTGYLSDNGALSTHPAPATAPVPPPPTLQAFAKIDLRVGQGGAVASEYQVRVTPTFLFFLDGREVRWCSTTDRWGS